MADQAHQLMFTPTGEIVLNIIADTREICRAWNVAHEQAHADFMDRPPILDLGFAIKTPNPDRLLKENDIDLRTVSKTNYIRKIIPLLLGNTAVMRFNILFARDHEEIDREGVEVQMIPNPERLPGVTTNDLKIIFYDRTPKMHVVVPAITGKNITTTGHIVAAKRLTPESVLQTLWATAQWAGMMK